MARTSVVFFTKCVATFLFLSPAVAAFAQTLAQDRVRGAVDDSQKYVVPSNLHSLARPEFDRGRADGSMKINHAAIVFKPSYDQQAAIEKLLAEQQDPSSSNYHKWLTPEQYAERFGMTSHDLATVSAWLQSRGLTVNEIARGRNRIFFTGTAAQIEDAFRTEIHQYQLDGELHFANATELSVPAAFAETVMGVGNLNDFRPKPRARLAKAHFTSSLSGQHYLAPDDLATIYDLKSLYKLGFDGTGEQIAIVGQTAISSTCSGAVCSTTDIDAFRKTSGLPATNLQQVLVTGSGTPVVSAGDIVEADLDIEWSGAVARNATIIFVYTGNSSNFNAFNSLQFAIDNKLAPVISSSYGSCEASLGGAASGSFLLTLQGEAQRANLQGQTIVAASGDVGAADCEDATATSATHGYAVDAPASIPEVTGVGGGEFSGDPPFASSPPVPPTDTANWMGANNMNMGSARGYITEMAWNDTTATGVGPDNTLSASGGGASIAFPKPSFQTLLTPADKQRDVPDISLSASPNHDGYILCTQGGCVNGYRNGTSLAVVGGTSAGAPTFAGIVAIINQATGSSKGVGNVNPELYTLAGMNSLHAFHDIVGPSSNRVPCTAGSTNCPSTPPTGCSVPCIGFGASVGYDQATGLGSIDALNLVTNWTGVLTTPDFAVGSTPLNLSAPGQSGTATITITAMEGFSGMVNLSFAPCPATAEITCTLSPSSVSVNGSVNDSSATATLSVSTSGPHASARISPADRPGSGWFATGGATLLAGFFVVSVPGRRRRWSGLMGILLLTLVAAGISCGGGSSSPHITDPGTPAGTYTIAVKATSGGVSHTTNVAVALQ